MAVPWLTCLRHVRCSLLPNYSVCRYSTLLKFFLKFAIWKISALYVRLVRRCMVISSHSAADPPNYSAVPGLLQEDSFRRYWMGRSGLSRPHVWRKLWSNGRRSTQRVFFPVLGATRQHRRHISVPENFIKTSLMANASRTKSHLLLGSAFTTCIGIWELAQSKHHERRLFLLLMAIKHLTIIQQNDTHGYLWPHSELFWMDPNPVFSMNIGGYARTAVGQVFCHEAVDGVEREMSNGGFEKDRQTLKKRCPAHTAGTTRAGQAQCPAASGLGIPLKVDRRVFTPIDRASYQWDREYKYRTAVERVNSRLDESFGFELHTIRGLQKMQMRSGLALVVMLAIAVGRIRHQHPDLMRSLVRSA